MARPDGLPPLIPHHAQRDLQRVVDRDGRGVRRLPLVMRLARGGKIPVKARQACGPRRLPGALADAEHGHAGRRHPGFLRARHHHVEIPRVGQQRRGNEPADGVDQEQHVGSRRARYPRDSLDRVQHAGRGFVLCEEHGTSARMCLQRLRHAASVGRAAPRIVERVDHQAKGHGDPGETVAEDAGAHGEDLVAR